MKLTIAADHGGFELKKFLLEWLSAKGYEVNDSGNLIFDADDDYPDFTIEACKNMISGNADRAIIICGSGVGACIAANKIKGIRASVCHDSYSAHQGVEHDGMNVLCLGARIIGTELTKEIVIAFLNAEFIEEERFIRRLNKIKELDK
ncbi:MAG: RpiB/LacA/LacB family sugar-phosphate isomerase [Bacteroidetes bacterium]|nr:RpiB/LacA/LacB family sugar-phosphate isomerase [Bacteroidota bacterium]MCH8941121.1 RpiB/LacA/LacB family sugar-phosphate isomerase [Bacteroidota bacterium]